MKNQWQLPVIASSTIISNKILVIIFEHFLPCILRRATSGEKWEGLPCQFLKMEKSTLILQKRYPFLQKGVLILEKKYPVCVHLWFTSPFKMQVQEYLREKNSETFSFCVLLLYVVHETFTEMPLYQKTSRVPENFLVACLVLKT